MKLPPEIPAFDIGSPSVKPSIVPKMRKRTRERKPPLIMPVVVSKNPYKFETGGETSAFDIDRFGVIRISTEQQP